MERPEYISYILIVLLLFLSPVHTCPETSYRQQIYQAYLKGDMDTWDYIIKEMEKEELSSVSEKLELLSYYYGYTGYLIGVKEKKRQKR
ncbi:MAG: hypothetical protein LUG51_05410 [Tannerellaceae bacterium]|nr:hypothetical protein [Tannerellaceae bacterium]